MQSWGRQHGGLRGPFPTGRTVPHSAEHTEYHENVLQCAAIIYIKRSTHVIRRDNMAAQNPTKPFVGHGSDHDPAGELTALLRSPSEWGWGWLPYSPRTPLPTLGPSGFSSPVPHDTVSSDAAGFGPCFFCPLSAPTLFRLVTSRSRAQSQPKTHLVRSVAVTHKAKI